jgi:hypothetical protein
MNWNLSTVRRMFKPARQRPIRNKNNFRPRVESLETRLAPANVPILSGHYDNLLTGWNSQETALNPTTVNDASFGKLFNYTVDGYTYAQPLYVPNLNIGGATYNVVFAATEHDSLYAFNADAKTGGHNNDGLLWQRSFIDPINGINTMPAADTSSSDIVPEVGITGTPVIDPATNTLYVIAKTKEVRSGDPANAHYVQKLYAIDITTGHNRASNSVVTIGDTAYINGTNTFVSDNTAISVPGTGAGSVGPAGTASVQAGGSGYAVNDTITLAGGTTTQAVVLKVTSVSGGAVTGVIIQTAGNYSAVPSNPVAQAATSGGGTGATFNMTWTVVNFNARKESDRMSLQLVPSGANKTVYLAYASHGDNGPYHGWVIGYNAADLSLQKLYNTSPNGSASGIWESGGNLGFDAQGNLYFSTGNGFGTGFNFNSGGPTALGTGGGGLGYQNIGNSLAVALRAYDHSSTGLGLNGLFAPTAAPTVNPTGGGTTGGSLAAGTYYGTYTFVFASGYETPASPESSQFTVADGNIPQVSLPALPSGVAGINLYLTPANGAQGSEVRYATGITTRTYNMTAANTGTIVSPTNFDLGGNTGINFNDGAQAMTPHVYQVTLEYSGTTLTETIRDLTTGSPPTTHPYNNVNIQQLVGGTTAYVGFTGGTGTGGRNAEQDIKTWMFTPSSGAVINHASGFTTANDLTANGGSSLPPYTAPNPVGNFQYHQDLGIPGDPTPVGTAAFNSNLNGGTYTLTGSGTDIGFKATQYDTDTDRMQLAYNAVTGTDGEIIARVNSLTGSRNPADPTYWTKAVVQIRQSLDPQAANVESVMSPHNVSEMTWRNTPPAIDNAGNQAPSLTGAQERVTGTGPLPGWIRLVRNGSHFMSFWAEDTVDGEGNHVPGPWQGEIDHDTTMNGDVYIGIGLSAHANGQTATATFDNVSVTGFTARTIDPVAVLTPAANTQAGSIFSNNKVDISGNWSTTFTFQMRAGSDPIADGMTFTIQNAARGTEISESVLKLSTTGSGPSLSVADYFTPHDFKLLDDQDADLGSGGTLLLPDGVSGGKHLMVETGKTGRLYLIDRDNMGQFNTRYDHIVQIVTLGGTNQTPGVWGNPAFFQDGPNTGLLYYWGSSAPGQAFRITDGVINPMPISITTTSPTPVPGRPTDGRSNFPGTQPTISSNGMAGSSGIMWALRSDGYGINGTQILYAYNAEDLTTLLWSSTNVQARDEIGGSSVKFTMPIVSNGHVYAGANGTLTVYGMLANNTAIPGNPANLQVTRLSPLQGGDTKLQLSWNAQSDATLFKIERTATLDNAAASAAVQAAGAGYAINDTITLAGGTFTQAAVLKVTAVGAGGAIAAVSIVTGGRYSATPANPVAQASTSGSGSGAAFTMTWAPPFTQVAEVGGNQTSYTDTGLTALTHYWYRIRATNQMGDSTNYSMVADAFTHLAGAKVFLTNVASKDIDLSWSSVLTAGIGNRYDVERSSDNFANPANTTIVGPNLMPSQTSFADTTVVPGNTYYYRVHAFNMTPAPSDESFSAVVSAVVAPVDIEFPSNGSGAITSSAGLQFNGSANLSPTENLIRLTDDQIQAGSIFTNNRVDASKFRTTFWVRVHEGTQPDPADGFTFTVQANSPVALGGTAAALGYAGIGKSVAIKFGLFNQNTTGLYTNGQSPTTASINIDRSIVNLADQHRKRIDISYDASALQLSVTITDEQHDGGPTSVSQTYTVDIPSIVGGGAYVGFTGGTGGNSANGTGALYTLQDVLGWVFPPTAPAAPDSVTATLGTSGDINLSWKDRATSEDGYLVQRSLDGYHFNIVAELGVGANSYHDTATVNNTIYYYRVGAFNTLGTGYSTTVVVKPADMPINHSQLSDGFASNSDLQASGTGRFLSPVDAPDPSGNHGIFTADRDIGVLGNPATEGSASFSVTDGVYTLKASGDDIFNNSDAFHFEYVPLHGNGQITARITSLDPTHSISDTTKAGVMIREFLTPDSREVSMVDTRDRSFRFQRRANPGATTDRGPDSDYPDLNNPLPPPLWLLLRRQSNVFTAFWAVDVGGTPGAWTQIDGPQTINMASDVFIGLALTAHNNDGSLNSATFDHVSVNTAAVLTDGGTGQAGSIFTAQRLPTTGTFTTSFVMNINTATGSGNGLAFVLQADSRGAGALGGSGAALGYGAGDGRAAISPSVAVKFDLFSQGSHASTTGEYINGATGTTGQIEMPGIDFRQNHTYQVDLSYDGLTLRETIRDLVSDRTFTTAYAVNLRSILGADTAFAGFTAGTSSETARIALEGWTASFNSLATPPHLEGTNVTPRAPQSGELFAVTVSQKTPLGPNVGYRRTVHFTSSDPNAILPHPYPFTAADAGSHTFTLALLSVGPQTITLTDDAGLTDTFSFVVSPTSFLVTDFPSPTTAGDEHTITVRARDFLGGTATGYVGTVHFTSTDGQAVLPADYTFTTGDAGEHSFTVTLKTAGTQSITVADKLRPADSAGTQSGIVVDPAAFEHFVIAGFPLTTMAGDAHEFTVTAKDLYGNTITDYTGTVHLSSNDNQADFSSNDYMFTSDDAGAHTFTVTLKTAGSARFITAADSDAGVQATQDGIHVTPGAGVGFMILGLPSSVVAGQAYAFIVTAVDAWGNTGAIYTGTVNFSSTDGMAGLPANYTFTTDDNGQHVFSVTFHTPGTRTLKVTDTLDDHIIGEQGDISVV